jgi:pimeloyl-ACP methyl ester carboxylesterase
VSTVDLLRILIIAASGLAAACQQAGAPPEQASQPEGAPLTVAGAAQTVAAPDGVLIHYDDQGAGRPTLVFVHGWNCDRSYWNAQRDVFAADYRVVTLDLAGHGDSGQDRTDWTMQAFGADVAAVVKALDLQQIVLVGHSMGGKVVVEAANQLQGRVLAVVGADTLHNGGRATPRAEQVLAELEADYEGFVAGLVTRMFVAESDPSVRDFVLADMAAAPFAMARGARVASGYYDATPAIAAMNVPLILISSDYRPTDKAYLEATAKSFQYREMTGVGHFLMMEDPEAFNAHLHAVLQGLVQARNVAFGYDSYRQESL